jgi:toxin ParE1/3/4
MRIRWTRPALNDLDIILVYIAERNPVAAKAVAGSVKNSVQRLRENPNSGRSGRVAGTQELVIPKFPYIVAYRIHKENIEVLAVRHTARMWPDQL